MLLGEAGLDSGSAGRRTAKSQRWVEWPAVQPGCRYAIIDAALEAFHADMDVCALCVHLMSTCEARARNAGASVCGRHKERIFLPCLLIATKLVVDDTPPLDCLVRAVSVYFASGLLSRHLIAAELSVLQMVDWYVPTQMTMAHRRAARMRTRRTAEHRIFTVGPRE